MLSTGKEDGGLYNQEAQERSCEMYLTSYLDNGTLTVELTGEIDHHCAKHYIENITAKLEAYTPRICVLDFSEVTFMDSSGIAVVINCLRSITKMDGQLYLTGLRPQPQKVLCASGIHKLVKIKEGIS